MFHQLEGPYCLLFPDPVDCRVLQETNSPGVTYIHMITHRFNMERIYIAKYTNTLHDSYRLLHNVPMLANRLYFVGILCNLLTTSIAFYTLQRDEMNIVVVLCYTNVQYTWINSLFSTTSDTLICLLIKCCFNEEVDIASKSEREGPLLLTSYDITFINSYQLYIYIHVV